MRHRTSSTILFVVLALVTVRPDAAAAQDESPTAEVSNQMGATPLMLQGFGDINYVARAPEGERGGFVNGGLDLFLTSRLGDNWSALAELVFEVNDNELATDLERFQFTYERSDALRVSLGRMHHPLLRWPITNHHGLFNQTPIDRPIIARWEDEPGLWPMHFVGVLGQGRFDGPLAPSYSVGIGNGRGRSLDEVQMSGDANDQRAVVVSFGVSPDAAPGLNLSISGYADEIPSPDEALRERDATLSGSYVRGAVEVRAEWSRMRHTAVVSRHQYETTGWYTLVGYRLPGRASRAKPYVLIEGLDAAEGEVFLEGAPDEQAWAAGLRWDASRWVGLKGDYRSRRLRGTERLGAVRLQIAVNF